MKHYTFVDYATQAYLLIVGLVILLGHNERTPLWPLLLAAHAVGLALVHLLIRAYAARPRGGLFEFLRHFYPVLLYTGFYRETGELHHMLFPEYLDPALIRLEEQIFGFQPSLVFMDRLPYLALSELFYAAYFTYYVMIVGVGLALYFRQRRRFYHYVSVVSFVFYLCYLTYIIVPVMGPRIFYLPPEVYTLPAHAQPAEVPAYPQSVKVGPFFQIMALIYSYLEAPGAAFPSSHVAVAICTVYFSFRYLRKIRHVHLVDVILLCLSTIYCRYHYVVDVVAGIAVAGLLVPLGNWLYFKFTPSEDDPEPTDRSKIR
jgi:membrane-associated phospholipid phosphatase